MGIPLAELANIPLIIAFMIFMLKWQSSQQKSSAVTHAEWRKWQEAQNKKLAEERDAWRDWLQQHDEVYATDRERTIGVLRRLERRIEVNTNVVLLIYSHLAENEDDDSRAQIDGWLESLGELNGDI